MEVCPVCEKECRVKKKTHIQDISVLGEKITVKYELFQCLECGNGFDDPQNPADELDMAYRKYREKHGIMQPEEIIVFREKLKFSHKEMAKFLGITIGELLLCEKGALLDLQNLLKLKEERLKNGS